MIGWNDEFLVWDMSNFTDRMDVESSFVVSDPRVGTSGEVNARNRLEIRELDGEISGNLMWCLKYWIDKYYSILSNYLSVVTPPDM